jgi:hypothetical protein
MLTETYRKPQPTEETAVSASTDVELYEQSVARRRKLLTEAGFHTLVKEEVFHSHAKSKLETTRQLFEELDGKRLGNWKRFLPTVTSTDNYTFDAVPEEALEAIISAKGLRLFSRIEIWTPEGNSFLGLVARKLELAKDKLDRFIAQLDPMAVGVLTIDGKEHFFPIVRWGESLLPYHKIRNHNWRTHGSAWVLFGLLPALLVMFGLAAYYNSIVQHGYGVVSFFTIVGVIISIFAVMAITAFLDMIGW